MPNNEFAFTFKVLGLSESTQGVNEMARSLENLATRYEATQRRINQATQQNRTGNSSGALNGGSFGGPINGSMSSPVGSAEQARVFERLMQNMTQYANKQLSPNQQYNVGNNEFMLKLQTVMQDSGNILGQSIVRAMAQGSTALQASLLNAFKQGAELQKTQILTAKREAEAIGGHSAASGKSWERAFQEMHRVGGAQSFVGTLAGEGLTGRQAATYDQNRQGYEYSIARTGASDKGGYYVAQNDAATLQHINRLAQESAYAFAQAFQKVTNTPVTRMADLYAINPELASRGEAVGTIARSRLESAQQQANNKYKTFINMGMSDDQAWSRSRPTIQEDLTRQGLLEEKNAARSPFGNFLYNKTGTTGLGQYLGRSALRTGSYAIDAAAIYGGYNLAHRGFEDVVGVQQHQLGLEQILPDQGQRARLVNGLYGQAMKYGEKPTDAMDVGYKMQSTFGNTGDALKATNSVFLLTRTSTMSLTDAMNGLVAVTDSYDTGAKGMSQTVNGLIVLQNQYGVSAQNTLEAMAKLSPLFQEFGISQNYGMALTSVVQQTTGESPNRVADKLERVLPQFQNSQAQGVLARIGVKDKLGFDYTSFAGEINAQDILMKLQKGYQSGALSKPDLQAVALALGEQRNSGNFVQTITQGKSIMQRTAALDSAGNQNVAEDRWKTLSKAAVNQIHQLDAAFLALVQDTANSGLLQAFTLMLRGVTDLTKMFASVFNDITMVTSALGPFGTALKAIAGIALATAGYNRVANSSKLVSDVPLVRSFYGGRVDRLGQPYSAMTVQQLRQVRTHEMLTREGLPLDGMEAERAAASDTAAMAPKLLGQEPYIIPGNMWAPRAPEARITSGYAPLATGRRMVNGIEVTGSAAEAGVTGEAAAAGALLTTSPGLFSAFRTGMSSSIEGLKALTSAFLLASSRILTPIFSGGGTALRGLAGSLRGGAASEGSAAEGGVLGFLQQRYVAARGAQLTGTLGADGMALSEAGAGALAASEAAGMGIGGLGAFAIGSTLLPAAAIGGGAYAGLRMAQGLWNDSRIKGRGIAQTNQNSAFIAANNDPTNVINTINKAVQQGDANASQGSTLHHLGRYLTGSNTPATIRWSDIGFNTLSPEELKKLGLRRATADDVGHGVVPSSYGATYAGQVVYSSSGEKVDPNSRLTTKEAKKLSDLLTTRAQTKMDQLSASLGGLISPDDMLFRNQQMQASYQYGAPNVNLYGTGPQNASTMKQAGQPATEKQYISQTVADIGSMTKEMQVYLAQGDPQNKAKDIATKIDQLQQALINTLNAGTQATAAYQAYFQGASGAAQTQLAADQTILARFPDQNSAEAMAQKLKVAQDYTAAISAPYDVQSTAASTLSGVAVLPQDRIRSLQSIASAANGKARALMSQFGDASNSNVQQAMSSAITANKNVLDAINDATQQGISASENLATASTHNTLKQAAIKVKAAQDIISAQQGYEGATSALLKGSTGNPVIDQFIQDFQQQSQSSDQNFNKSIDGLTKSSQGLTTAGAKLTAAAGSLVAAAGALAAGGAASANGNIPYAGEAQGSFGANTDQGAFIQAIKMQESGGNYKAKSPAGALGAYQIMPANLPAWSQAAVGRVVSPQEFLNSPQLQDQIAQYELGQLFHDNGPAGAASIWYSGSSNYKGNNGVQKGGPSVNGYVQSVVAKYNQIKLYQGIAAGANKTASAPIGMGGGGAPKFGGGSNTIGYIKALAASTGMSMIDTSDYRPGTGSYHGLSEAVDFSNPGNNQQVNAQFATMMSQMFGKYITEEIWAGTGAQGSPAGQGAIFIKNGKPVNAAFYGQSTVGDHHNHVHIAIDPKMAGALSASGAGGGAGAGASPTLTNDFANLMNALYEQDMAKYQVDALKNQLGQSYSQGGQLIAQVKSLKEKAMLDLKWDDIGALYQDFLDFRQASLDLAKQRIQNTVNILQLKGDPSNQVFAYSVQITQAKQQMQAWLANGGNTGDNEYTSLQLQVKNAQRDQALQKVQYSLTDVGYQYQMHQLGWGQYIQNLTKLRNQVDTSTRAGKELFQQINEQIQGLVDSLDQSFNISSNIALPTLYQVRRSQAASNVGDASAFTNTLATTVSVPVYGTVPGVNYGTPGGAVPQVVRSPNGKDPAKVGNNHDMDLLHFQVNSQALLAGDQTQVDTYKSAQGTDQQVLLLYKYVLGWLKAHNASKSQIAAQQALVASAVQKMNTDNAGMFYSTIQQKLDISRSQVALNTWQQHVKSLIQKTVAMPHANQGQNTPWGVVNQVTINAQGANAQQVASLVAKNFGTQVGMVRTRNSTGTRYY